MGIRTSLKALFSKNEEDTEEISSKLEDLKNDVTIRFYDIAIGGISAAQKVFDKIDKTSETVLKDSKEKVNDLKSKIEEETKDFKDITEEHYNKTKEYIQEKLNEENNNNVTDLPKLD